MTKTVTITLETKQASEVGIVKVTQFGFTSDYELIGVLEQVKRTVLNSNYERAVSEMSDILFKPDQPNIVDKLPE